MSAAHDSPHGGFCCEEVYREAYGRGTNGTRADRRWEERQAEHRRLESRPGQGPAQVRSRAPRPPLDGRAAGRRFRPLRSLFREVAAARGRGRPLGSVGTKAAAHAAHDTETRWRGRSALDEAGVFRATAGAFALDVAPAGGTVGGTGSRGVDFA